MAFLEYGWPINFSSAKLPKSTFKNHSSALKRPDIIDDYIKTEMQNAAIIGPFESNPFSSDCVVSPLQVVIKDSTSKPRIVHDLSFPERFSVNDGISNDTFLNDSFELRLPGVDRLIEFIREKGKGCHIFKTDLRRAFRQIPVDPADIPLLGFQVNDLLSFHVVLPFGLRSAVLICQRTTKAVVFILTKDNALVDVYIDDFFGAATVQDAPFVYNRLLFLLRELGLEISPEKCFEPSSRMVCLGLIFDTELMIISVPEDKIVKLKEELCTWLSRLTFSRRQLQSLLGKLSYVTACIQPGRIFMNRLLNVLRFFTSRKQRLPVTMEMRNDILWWLQFLDLYNGVSVIPELYWREDTLSFSNDACLTGCGGLAFGEYFHAKFPDFILSQDLPIQHSNYWQLQSGLRSYKDYVLWFTVTTTPACKPSITNALITFSCSTVYASCGCTYHCITFRYTLSTFQEQLIHLQIT